MTVARLAGSLVVLTLAACADQGAGGASGGTLVLAVPSSWTPGPPPMVNDLLGRVVADQLYDRLAEIGLGLNTVGDAGFTPRLAQRWTWSTDSMSIAFELHPLARWHDGRPVRASDVRFTLNVFKDPKTASSVAPLLANVDSVSVRDSLTAVVWYHRRTPEQFYDFVYQVQPMPEHVWKDVPRDKLATSDAARAPIGSGRFRFEKFEPGVSLVLTADTANFRGRARLDRVVWSFVPDMGAAITHLLSGQADFLEIIPAEIVPRVDSSGSLRVLKYQGFQYGFVGFNSRDPKRTTSPHPVLSDRRVRRALSMALDRQSMLRNVYDTLGTLGVGPFPSAMRDTAVKLLPFDRAHAAALLDSAGWVAGTDGVRRRGGKALTLSILVPTSSRARMRYAVLIQEQWKAVGVSAAIEALEFRAFLDRQNARNFDVLLAAGGYDPSKASIKQAWATSGITRDGQNYLAYSNPTFDALIDSALASFQPEAARSYARRAFQTVVDDAPAVWVYDVLTIAGLHKRVRPESMRADGWWVGLADWWIPAGERIERDRIGLRPASP